LCWKGSEALKKTAADFIAFCCFPTATGPECVKTLIASSSWRIDVCRLIYRIVSVTACIGNDLEHANAVLQPLAGSKPAFLG